MNRKAVFFIFVSVLAGLNLGTVRKAEDPIRDTQTSGILYEQKKEEEKDGKKGPLMYNVKYNPRESFFIDPPFEKEKKDSSKEAVTEKAYSPADAAGWWEEQPTTSQAVPATDAAPESLPETLAEEEKVQDRAVAEQPAAAPPSEAQDAPSGKGDDYWW